MATSFPPVAIQSDSEARPGATSAGQSWPVRLLPSAGDLLFCLLLCLLAAGHGAVMLLNDGDAGWHIRNGQHILATGAIPRVDYFSWTRAGHAWYAWEWLFDVLDGAVHRAGGLNAVVALGALLLALTFRLLFGEALKRSGDNWLLAGFLTLLTLGAASQHLLARPDLVTLLFSIVWLGWLEQVRAGTRLFWRFPLVMLLWTNLHGGFIIGLALLTLYLMSSTWEGWFAEKDESSLKSRGNAWRLASCLALCGAATLVNPYGWRLHAHILHYLSDSFLMGRIQEFAPPNFHVMAGHCFELLVLATVWMLFRFSRSFRLVDLLLTVLAIHLGVIAVRNLGLAAIILTFVLAGVAGREAAVQTGAGRAENGRHWLRNLSRRLAKVERMPRLHWLPLATVLAGAALILNHGMMRNRVVLDAHFSLRASPGEAHYGFPARAAARLQAMGTPPHLLTTDSWAGYLMYRLYPRFHPFFDGRSDFYGDGFVKEYLRAISARPGWQAVLDREQVRWVLLPPDVPLATVLRESSGWTLAYQDGNSLLFRRRPAVASRPLSASHPREQ